MRICLVLEGCYPYVTGGVSSWAHQLIQALPEHEFVLWTIGATPEKRGQFKYELPENVVEVYEMFLAEALDLRDVDKSIRFTPVELEALTAFVHCESPDWDIIFDAFHDKNQPPLTFLMSEDFLEIISDICRTDYPYTAFADMFHTMRSMLLPVLYSIGQRVPEADCYHAIATGYSGILACLGGYSNNAPVMLSEHGIYTREREEEIIRATWVLSSFKRLWGKFFIMLSECIYKRAVIVTSLFDNARQTQIDLGCYEGKCRVTPNGVKVERFSHIQPKAINGFVDIGAIVRIAPIKDIKTLLYAFSELKYHVPNARLHIIGPEDDKEYSAECYQLVEQLELPDVVFTGTVNVIEYLPKLDFTVLSSISEGMPLTVLESFAAGRPCVTTDVGCCRQLLEGGKGDTFGRAGIVVEPMNRMALSHAMEYLCTHPEQCLEMGRIGRERVHTFYRHEDMIETYRSLYQEVNELWQA